MSSLLELLGISLVLNLQDKLDYMEYSEWALEELLAEEKRIKKGEITSAVMIGFLVGIMIYGVAKDGTGILYIIIPVFLILGIYRNSKKQKQKLKEIQLEIKAKNPGDELH